MTVRVAIVTGQQPVQHVLQIRLRPAASLHQGEAGGGVGQEHVEQAVASHLCGGRPDVIGHIHDPSSRRVDIELPRLHPRNRTEPAADPPSARSCGLHGRDGHNGLGWNLGVGALRR